MGQERYKHDKLPKERLVNPPRMRRQSDSDRLQLIIDSAKPGVNRGEIFPDEKLPETGPLLKIDNLSQTLQN